MDDNTFSRIRTLEIEVDELKGQLSGVLACLANLPETSRPDIKQAIALCQNTPDDRGLDAFRSAKNHAESVPVRLHPDCPREFVVAYDKFKTWRSLPFLTSLYVHD